MERDKCLNCEKEHQLSILEQQKNIRTYLWKIFAFPGGLVAVALFFGGYLLNEGAMQKARNDAFSMAQKDITGLMNQVMESKHQIKESERVVAEASRKVQESQERVGKISQNLNDLDQKFNTSKVLMATDPQIKDIVNALIADPRVTQAIESKTEPAIESLKLTEENLRKVLDGLRIEFKDMETSSSNESGESAKFAFPVKRAWIEFAQPVDSPELEIAGIKGNGVTIRSKHIGRPGPRHSEVTKGPLLGPATQRETKIKYRLWAVGF